MKPLPQSIHDRAELLARSHPIETVAELVGLNLATVYKMRRRGWRACGPNPRRRPVPTDWALVAGDKSVNELAAHYGTKPYTVMRWLRERPVRPLWVRGRRWAA